ncbi:MAG: cadherin-like beta sandwich domain-containing protein [Prevotellaceae bacterium]|jgi:hypothetical protein|nr:cadherin-like beta sandwich domain-containing protein [Prevotellaceae bacterium]
MADNSWSYTELSSLPNNIVLHETVTIDNGTCVATTGVTLNKTATAILVNGTEELTATVVPSDATNKSVTWSSSNTSVATVNNGIVTGIAAGTATITVTTVDGNITTCVVTVMSSDATLKSLIVSSGSLSFDANTTNYTVNVGNDVTSINITGTANNTAARVTGNVTGKALDIGDNVITITVTAEDGTTTKAYTVTIVRVASSDASLKSLTVSSGTLSFDANTTDYTVNVSNEVTNIDVTGTANHVNATVTGNIAGKVLNTGNNEIKITVTAEDGVTTKTYTVTVVYENAAIILNAFSLNNNVNIALSSTVDLVYNFSGGVPTEYIADEKPDLSGSQWKTYNPAKLTYSFESGEYGIKTVYTRLRNDKGETGIMSDVIYYKPFYEISIDSFDDNYDQTRSIIGSLYDKSVSVYPNPVEIYANVIIDNIESPAGKVEIYSLTGAMYLSQEFTGSKFSIDMSRCPSGIFLIKLTVGDVQVTKRIIKL